jgi:predicted nucleic acid-binding protein
MRVLVDTNVLLRWAQVTHPSYAVCRNAVDALVLRGDDLCIATQNAIEFWNVLTRPPERNGFGLNPEDAGVELATVELLFQVIPASPAFYPEWRSLVHHTRVRGVQVHDAHLAAVMRVSGVSHILTFNGGDFNRYQGITPIDPADVQPPPPPAHPDPQNP